MRLRRAVFVAWWAANLLFGLSFSPVAEAAEDCPCIQTGGRCIPNPACDKNIRKEAVVPRPSPDFAPPSSAREYHRREFRYDPAPATTGNQAPEVSAPSAPGDSSPIRRPADAPGPRARILATGYDFLRELGQEKPGFGLYSYAILPGDPERAAAFLDQVFKDIPTIDDAGARPSQLNIFYVPLLKDKEAEWTVLRQDPARAAQRGQAYIAAFYDHRMARNLLAHICNPPHRRVEELCAGDFSRGPYIFTYAAPASHMEPVPPPFLFVDLSDVHPRAFGELLAAFQAQVKREDISDEARIRTMRLQLLQFVLSAADWVSPVQKAMKDIVHFADSDDGKK